MYAKNATRGQWKAHGRYIARESASQGRAVEAGFDATERGINISALLDQWQSAGDERMWNLIVSPEFGEKIDLVQLTRDLMQRMTRDLDTRLANGWPWRTLIPITITFTSLFAAFARMVNRSVSNAIPGEAKVLILDELRKLNINEFSIYNDLDHLALEIKQNWHIV